MIDPNIIVNAKNICILSHLLEVVKISVQNTKIGDMFRITTYKPTDANRRANIEDINWIGKSTETRKIHRNTMCGGGSSFNRINAMTNV